MTDELFILHTRALTEATVIVRRMPASHQTARTALTHLIRNSGNAAIRHRAMLMLTEIEVGEARQGA